MLTSITIIDPLPYVTGTHNNCKEKNWKIFYISEKVNYQHFETRKLPAFATLLIFFFLHSQWKYFIFAHLLVNLL